MEYTVEELQQLESSVELHEFMLHYNWDDGIEKPHAVVNNENCDRGTALMIYWLLGPRYLYHYENRKKINAHYEIEHLNLLEEVERKYLSEFYRNKTILFNPRYDSVNDGYDHTQTYDDLLLMREIPAEMFEPSIPDLEWEAMGRPIKPIKKIDYDFLYKELDDEWSEELKDLDE